jgi:hypothetical protein
VTRPIACAAALAVAAIASSAGAVDRDEILATAPLYYDHEWTCTSTNHTGTDCPSSYTSDFCPGTYSYPGLPYDWGGYVTVEQFDADIADGLGAGSHSSDGVLDCTTGVDCSGYVSELWECGHQSTSTIPDISTAIDTRDMWPGDVFNDAGSHVIMWIDKGAGGEMMITESSGTCDGVCYRAWSISGSYTPRRPSTAYVQTPTVGSYEGTTDDPIPIDALPFRDYRNTRVATSSVFDTYSAAPSTDESGPEYIYQIDLPSAGTVTAHVLDAPGADIDLHLLSALDASECLGRADIDLSVAVDTAGTYYLTADSWNGTDYAGAYVLDVDFSAGGDTDSDTDTDTDSDTDSDSDADADSDTDADSDGDSDGDSDSDTDGDSGSDSDSDSDSNGAGDGRHDDGCGCLVVGRERPGTEPDGVLAMII